MGETTESLILEVLQKESSLKTVNNYGENLLHIAAANGCLRITREILEKKKICNIDRKNVFGWTPLMQAIRNGKIDSVKVLLINGASLAHSTYHGISVIGLATAVGREMFEIVYKADPSALKIASQDKICPLSVAAMKNDKDLFFRLLELDLDVSKANTFAHSMMKCSLVPEISALAKPPQDIESYWNDSSDNIEILDDLENHGDEREQIKKEKTDLPAIIVQEMDVQKLGQKKSSKRSEPLSLIIPCDRINMEYKSLISPTLIYNFNGAFPPSPKPIFPNKEKREKCVDKIDMARNLIFLVDSNSLPNLERPLQRCQKIRPPDLKFVNEPRDLNNTLSFIPEYSPTKSPNVPPEIEDENAVFGENTPTPPHETTPPRAFILTPKEAHLAFFLHKRGLGRFISTFLEQEVDIGLFVTLSNDDFKEIGIEKEEDRHILLLVIEEYHRTKNEKNEETL